MKPICRVVKLGGSLLTLPGLGIRFHRWIGEQTPATTLIVVGGGDLVEAIRVLASVHTLEQSWCHWQCISLLETTAEIAQRLLKLPKPITSPQTLRAAWGTKTPQPTPLIVSPSAYYTPTCAHAKLPEDWSTTSDSLAACLANQISAGELVLLKSIGERERISTSKSDLQNWKDLGWVDQTFPDMAERIPRIRAVNLRL